MKKIVKMKKSRANMRHERRVLIEKRLQRGVEGELEIACSIIENRDAMVELAKECREKRRILAVKREIHFLEFANRGKIRVGTHGRVRKEIFRGCGV